MRYTCTQNAMIPLYEFKNRQNESMETDIKSGWAEWMERDPI